MKTETTPVSESSEPAEKPKKGIALPFDPMRVIDAVVCRWKGILFAGILCAALAFGAAFGRFRNEYQSGLHLIRQEPPNAFSASETGETFKPRTLAVQTVVSIMRSPTLLKMVSDATGVSPGALNSGLTLVPERNTDLIRVEFKTAASADFAVRVVNNYAAGVVEMTKKMQADEAAAVNRFLQEQLERADKEMEAINAELLAYGREAKLLNADKELDAYLRKQSELDLKYETTRIEFETIGLRISSTEHELSKNSPGTAKLQTARDELTALLSKFTESNPLVLEQRSKIAALEKQIADSPNQSGAFPQSGESGVADSLFLELVQLRATQKTLAEQVKKLDEVRGNVTRQLGALPEKQMNYARIQSRKTSLENARTLLESRQREASLFSQNALGYYRVLAIATPGEVAVFSRSKKLTIFGVLGLFAGSGLACLLAIRRKAFDGRLATSLDLRRATSLEVLAILPKGTTRLTQREAWAFRTWTALRGRLGVAERGGVLGVLSREPGAVMKWLELFGDAASRRGQRVVVVGQAARGGLVTLGEVLENPAMVLDLLDDRNPLTVSIEETFVWTAENRSRWHAATQLWLKTAGVVVLLEITAPGEPESVLLCERLPGILFLASGGACTVDEASALIAPYREAGCTFAGAALNDAPELRPAWLASKLQAILSAFLLFAFLGLPAHAAAPKAAKPAWLQRYVLGAGDGFNIGIYGHTDLQRNDVFVAADGRLTYLHANVMAAGLTVDELRAVLNREMARYYQHAQVILSPIVYASKRVFVLGKVVNKGAIMLDRPLTVLEAVAEAGGLETGLFQLNTVELADLPRSLLVRKGRRVNCDFEKLFNEGDMSFNHLLEPDDYLFFPSSNSNEFHLFGSVQNPGTQALTPNASVVSSLATGGSFTRKAWRKRVLVVRGSLSKPQAFAVNVDEVLSGNEKDFRLEPHDIVYVADRPWAKVEELVENALTAFTQAAVASWTGANVGPFIKDAILPQR
jgi:protein involved in polysaccharide export with SLBB domain/capsular polysaccharide biosynthesis protein